MRRKREPIIGACKLCGNDAELQDSHIISALVFRELKRRTGVGNFITAPFGGPRMVVNRKRAQDGQTRRWLCEGCEAHLSRFEDQFARRFLRPYYDNRDGRPITYGPWLLKFAASLVWRVLLHIVEEIEATDAEDAYVVPEFRSSILDALQTWRGFVAPEPTRRSPGRFEIHITPIFVDETDPEAMRWRNTIIEFVPAVYRRSRAAYMVVKLPALFIFGTVQNPNAKAWRNTKIHVEGGSWGQHGVFLCPPEIQQFMQQRIRVAKEVFALARTQRQRAKTA